MEKNRKAGSQTKPGSPSELIFGLLAGTALTAAMTTATLTLFQLF